MPSLTINPHDPSYFIFKLMGLNFKLYSLFKEITMSISSAESATDRWEDEGGSQMRSLAKSFASVVAFGDDLLADARQKLLNRDAALAAFDKSLIKERPSPAKPDRYQNARL